MRYLLDTNAASHAIRGDLPQIRQRLIALPVGSVAVSVITKAELRYGVAKRGHPGALATLVDEFLRRMDVRAWTSASAAAYSTLRATTEKQGTPLAPLDLLIAAQAVAEDYTLITRDRSFDHVPGLHVDDWSR